MGLKPLPFSTSLHIHSVILWITSKLNIGWLTVPSSSGCLLLFLKMSTTQNQVEQLVNCWLCFEAILIFTFVFSDGQCPPTVSSLDRYLTTKLPGGVIIDDPSAEAITLLRILYGLDKHWNCLYEVGSQTRESIHSFRKSTSILNCTYCMIQWERLILVTDCCKNQHSILWAKTSASLATNSAKFFDKQVFQSKNIWCIHSVLSARQFMHRRHNVQWLIWLIWALRFLWHDFALPMAILGSFLKYGYRCLILNETFALLFKKANRYLQQFWSLVCIFCMISIW